MRAILLLCSYICMNDTMTISTQPIFAEVKPPLSVLDSSTLLCDLLLLVTYAGTFTLVYLIRAEGGEGELPTLGGPVQESRFAPATPPHGRRQRQSRCRSDDITLGWCLDLVALLTWTPRLSSPA